MPVLPPSDPRPCPRAPRRTLLAGLLLALCGVAGPAPAAQPTEAPAPTGAAFSIVAFGSSSTQGTGASSPARSYPAQLERLFDEKYHGHPAIAVTNKGIAGEDIDDMAKRLDADVLSRRPDLVLWQAGSNDSLRGVPVERFEVELRRGVAAMRAAGAEVMLIEPQWSPVIERADAKSRFVDAVREVGAIEHVPVVRRYTLMQDWVTAGLVTERDLVGPDNLHMTDRGYDLLAHAILDQVSAESSAFRARTAVASRRP